MQAQEEPSPRVGARELFVAFTRITLTSFGGAIFWSRRAIVEQKRWMSESEFVELLALAQMLPGASGANLAVLVGYRFGRVGGALAALGGFLAAPFAVIMSLGLLYRHFGALPAVHSALTGMAAVAVGLLIATAAHMIVVLRRQWLPWLFVIGAFIGIGIFRWPFLAVIGVLAPIAIYASWRGDQ